MLRTVSACAAVVGERMKTKSFIILLVCIVGTSFLLIAFGNQRPTIQNIVHETNKQLSKLNLKKENLLVRQPTVDANSLFTLGFVDAPRLYPEHKWNNFTLPPIVSAVKPGEEQLAKGFIKNARYQAPKHTIFVYDLGLGKYDVETLSALCNCSVPQSYCCVRPFDYSRFPAHVSAMKLKAYRPLIVQEVLNEVGAALWLDIDHRFVSKNLEPLIERAKTQGVLTWSADEPTSMLTHPKMFSFFHTEVQRFYFHRMVGAEHAIFFNTKLIHEKVMLPWVQCALKAECISPIGAQERGCRFDKKPLFRYSGCHRYDSSALTILLGLAFPDASNYTDSAYTFFRRLGEDWDYVDADSHARGNGSRLREIKRR